MAIFYIFKIILLPSIYKALTVAVALVSLIAPTKTSPVFTGHKQALAMVAIY